MCSYVSFSVLSLPNVNAAAMMNSAGVPVQVGDSSITYAFGNASNPLDMNIFMSPGNETWPMVSSNAIVVKTRSFTDCTKAKALVNEISFPVL